MHARSFGKVTWSCSWPLSLELAPCSTSSATCPLVPDAFEVWSKSHVYGPVPLALTWLIVTFNLPPCVTFVTSSEAKASSVFSPISMLPFASVRPHSLTTLAEISASEMKLASVESEESTIIDQHRHFPYWAALA